MITVNYLRSLAQALPEVTERETWGRPTFRVRDKMFLTLGDDATTATVKAKPDEQAGLVAADPDAFASAPYVGRHGWVRLQLDRVGSAQAEELVLEAWRQTAPKRLLRTFDEQP